MTDDTDITDTDGPVSFAGLFTSDFGNDGPKDTDDNDVADDDAISYELSLKDGPGTDSGLVDVLSGDKILLRVNGDGDIEGYLENDDTEVAFLIDLDANGDISLVQNRAITHDNASDPVETGNEAEDMAADLIVLTATITDGDGDTATATANIGDAFNFEDDGPSTYEPEDASLTNAPGAAVEFELDVLPGDIVDDIEDNFGADGPGLVRFSSTLDESDSGLTSGNVKIWYFLADDGQTLLAKTGATVEAAATGTLIFTVAIDHETSTYTVDMDGTVDSFTRIILDPTDASFVGGNDPWAGFNRDGAEDILLTPTGSGGQTLNTSDILLGVGGGQDVDDGEGVRIDFVNNLGGNPAASDPGGYADPDNRDHTFSGHYITNGASVRMSQENGDVAVATNVTANFAAFDDGPGDANTVVGDGSPDPINGITITYFGVTYTDPITTSQIIVPTTTPTDYVISGHTFTVQLMPDGSVNVTGIEGDNGSSGAGTEVAIFTATGYTSLVVSNVVDGTSFKISGFGIAEPSTDPVLISLPTEIVDGDGDVLVGGDIDIELTPAPPVVLDMNNDGLVSFIDRSAGVLYDYNSDGTAEATAWAAAGDGILVRDANGDGTVTDASEFVFGDADTTDMEALAAEYGSVLDANDADFGKFMVWTDANSNGAVDGGELQSLAEAGIASIGLVSDGVSYSAANGDVYVAGSGTYTRADGSTGATADAIFATGEAKTTQEVERVAANSNSLTIAAALAAAGISSAAAATEPGFAEAADGSAISALSVQSSAGASGILTGNSSPAFDSANSLEGGFEASLQAMSSSSTTAIAASQVGELAVVSAVDEGPAALLDATDLSPMLQMPMASNGMAVTQEIGAVDGTVGQIVVDALEGGEAAPSIDALLAALPGAGLGENAGPESLASPIGDIVPTWDTGHAGVFTNGAASIITSEAIVLHHDAVQSV